MARSLARQPRGRKARDSPVIHRNVVTRKADLDGLTARTVERDYVLAHVLTAISANDSQAQLVFKGGTSLRLCHFDDYRYSADLDFSLVDGLDVNGAFQIVERALEECRESIGFPVLFLNSETPRKIEYVGPLGAKPRSLKLDLADDEPVESTTIRPIVVRYEDQGSDQCLVYTLEEITAEKLRCVIQRLQCRDLYDLNELLVACDIDPQVVWPVFERKTRHRGFDPDDFARRFDERTREWQRRWSTELAEYVTSPPPFDGLIRAVRRELRFALK